MKIFTSKNTHLLHYKFKVTSELRRDTGKSVKRNKRWKKISEGKENGVEKRREKMKKIEKYVRKTEKREREREKWDVVYVVINPGLFEEVPVV